MDEHAFVAGVVDYEVGAAFECLAHLLCLKGLSVVIKYAAYKESGNVGPYSRPVRIAQIRISKYIAHLRNRKINNVAEQGCFRFLFDLPLSRLLTPDEMSITSVIRQSATVLVMASSTKRLRSNSPLSIV